MVIFCFVFLLLSCRMMVVNFEEVYTCLYSQYQMVKTFCVLGFCIDWCMHCYTTATTGGSMYGCAAVKLYNYSSNSKKLFVPHWHEQYVNSKAEVNI
jgi:hypothetical protein